MVCNGGILIFTNMFENSASILNTLDHHQIPKESLTSRNSISFFKTTGFGYAHMVSSISMLLY